MPQFRESPILPEVKHEKALEVGNEIGNIVFESDEDGSFFFRGEGIRKPLQVKHCAVTVEPGKKYDVRIIRETRKKSATSGVYVVNVLRESTKKTDTKGIKK